MSYSDGTHEVHGIAFTKSTIETSDDDLAPVDEDWCTIECKPLFNLNCLNTNVDELVGFKTDGSNTVTVHLKLGHFTSTINMIIHKAIYLMNLNELAHVSFEMSPTELDESFRGDAKSSEVLLDIKFELRLIRIEQETSKVKIYQKNIDQLLSLCQEHKKGGNELFQKSLVRTAFRRYHKAISYLIIAEQLCKEKLNSNDERTIREVEEEEENGQEKQSTDDLKKTINLIKSQLYSNMAACQLKAKNNEMAIENCTRCLKLDASNSKALFRRGQARLNKNDFDEACEDFRESLKYDPTNQDALNRIALAERLKKSYNANLSSNLKKMFL